MCAHATRVETISFGCASQQDISSLARAYSPRGWVIKVSIICMDDAFYEALALQGHAAAGDSRSNCEHEHGGVHTRRYIHNSQA